MLLACAARSADLRLGLSGPAGAFLFDMSVGYDLKGIRTAPVRAFLRRHARRARRTSTRCSRAWPERARSPGARARRTCRTGSPACITLSTFHGCPADEIERICEHLLAELGVHVVVKMNPTLLGYERGRARSCTDGWATRSCARTGSAFDERLQWDEALGHGAAPRGAGGAARADVRRQVLQHAGGGEPQELLPGDREADVPVRAAAARARLRAAPALPRGLRRAAADQLLGGSRQPQLRRLRWRAT